MKKKITLTVAAFLLCNLPSFCQLSHEWTTVAGSTGADYSNSIATDADGNIYSTGRFFDVTDFDPGPGNTSLTSGGLADIFITKQDPNGNLIWAKRIGSGGNDYGHAIQVDIAGNVVVVGSFSSTVDFDPGPGSSTFNAGSTSSDAFVVKLNSLGDFQWVKVFGGSNFQSALTVATDASSNVILSGYFILEIDLDPTAGTDIRSSAGGNDIFLVKLDPSGNYLWGGNAGNFSNDVCYSVSTDASDNVYATGQFNGTVDFNFTAGTNTISSNGVEDAFVLKMNSSGTFQWVKTLGGSGVDVGRSIDADAAGNVYTSGYFSGTADFDPSAISFPLVSAGSGDVFVSKLDQSGNFVWAKQFGSTGNDYALSMQGDGAGNLYVAGRYYATVDFDPNAGISSYTSNGDADVYVLQLDDSGNYVDVKTFGGLGADLAFSVALTAPNLIYVAGSFDQTVNFDPSGAGSTFTSNGLSDCFTTRYSTCAGPAQPVFLAGTNPSVCSGTTEIYNILSVPGATSYTWTLPGGWSGTSTAETIVTAVGTSGGVVSVTANNLCGSSLPATISVTVNMTPTISGSDVTVCDGESANLTASSDVGTIEWFSVPAGGSSIGSGTTHTTGILSGFTTLYVEANNNGCINDPRFTINVTVNYAPTIVGNDITICAGNEAQLQVTTDFGTVEWFDELTGGISLGTGAQFITGILYGDTTFYVEANSNSCINDPRFAVNVIVNPMPNIALNPGGGAIVSLQDNATSYQWIDCNNSNEELLNETSQMFVPTQNGSYAVVVNLNGCIDTSACEIISNVGFEELLNYSTILYPNPAQNDIHLQNQEGIAQVSVYSTEGKLILVTNGNDKSSFSLRLEIQSGMYYIHVQNAKSGIVESIPFVIN